MPEEDFVSVDMSKAKTIELIQENTAILAVLSAWDPRKSKASGEPSIHMEYTIQEPAQYANRKLFDDVNLVNEYTLGRFQNHLKALGFTEEEYTSPNFQIPPRDDVLGRQVTIWCKTQKSEGYGDQSRINRIRPAEAFSEVSA